MPRPDVSGKRAGRSDGDTDTYTSHVVLRESIELAPNTQFYLCHFKPASNLNPELPRQYEASILSAMRQARSSPCLPKS